MMEKLCDQVYYLPHQEEGDRPVLGYVRGGRRALMIDAGNGAEHVALFYAQLDALGLPPPDFCVLTHWHWDHTFGIHALPCPAIACGQTNGYIAEVARWEWTDEAMAQRLETGEDNEFCDKEIRHVYPDRSRIVVREADIVFDRVLTLELGGLTCIAERTENPHTADGVLVHIPQAGIVFLGDAAYQGNHHGRAPLYREKLAEYYETLRGMAFETAIPGHEAPMSKGALLASLLEEMRG